MLATAPQPMKNRPGRPKLADSVCDVTFTAPTWLYDLCDAEARARGVSLASVIREALRRNFPPTK
jgi:hypothetical protein